MLFFFFPIVFFILGIAAIYTFVYVRYSYHKHILSKAKYDKPSPSDGPDVIIIGAGIAGSAIATALARDGRRVTVIEKSKVARETIAGQAFMSGGRLALKELGFEIDEKALDGILTSRIQVHSPKGNMILVPAHPGLNARNEKSVEALRKLAQAEELCTFIEGNVKCLLKENDTIVGVQYVLKVGSEIKTLHAPLTVVADGKYSKFRSVNMTHKATISSFGVGFSTPNLPKEDPEDINVILCSAGTLFIFPRGVPSATMIILIAHEKQTKESLVKLMAEVPEKLRGLYKEALESSRLGMERAYYLPAVGNFVPGVITLGDAYSIRDPITASGMNMGLRDTKTWRSLLKEIPDLYNYDAMYAAHNIFCLERKSYSFTNDVFALFFMHLSVSAKDADRTLGKGYEDYVGANNPERLASVIALFALLETRPWVVMYHITLILLNAMTLAIKSERLLTLPRGIYKAAATFFTTSSFLLPHLWFEFQSMFAFKSKPSI